MTDMEHDFAFGTYDSPTGEEATPVVNWQTPAIGNRELSPEQAREFADWLESNADKSELNLGWLKFILLGDHPLDVAEQLREAATDAETEADRFDASVEQMVKDIEENQ